MNDNLQEPKSYRVKNGTENGRWDETQIAPILLSGIFAFLTTFFIVDNTSVHYLWWTFIIVSTFVLTLKSTDGSNMRNWQVYYNYLFSPKGEYDFTTNKKISLKNKAVKSKNKEK